MLPRFVTCRRSPIVTPCGISLADQAQYMLCYCYIRQQRIAKEIAMAIETQEQIRRTVLAVALWAVAIYAWHVVLALA